MRSKWFLTVSIFVCFIFGVTESSAQMKQIVVWDGEQATEGAGIG